MKSTLLSSLSILALLTTSVQSFGQAPALGTAGIFALFTAAGDFANVGATAITGDIGTHVGDLTGFPAGTVTGATHLADVVSAQAATDIALAYGDLSTRTCGTTLGTTLGAGQILTAGVYCVTSAATLNGVLTLDGQGQPNALFIIRLNGAFATADLSQVALRNGASFTNVYWQVNGAFTLGSQATFGGTALVNGAITLLQGATLQGRALSQAGKISLLENTVALASVAAPLPVVLTSFTASRTAQGIALAWTTASESNNAFFEVQRSSDGYTFTAIGSLPGSGTSSLGHRYQLVDGTPLSSLAYYRLRQVDTDKRSSFSPVITVSGVPAPLLAAYPNPSAGTFALPMGSSGLPYRVFTGQGRTVQQGTITDNALLLAELAPGTYFLQLADQRTQRLVRL